MNCVEQRKFVPPEERREVVLEFLDEHDLALSPTAIFRGLKTQRGITFSKRTTSECLSDLLEEGYVVRVDKDALDNGRIEPLPQDESGSRAWYYITDEGRASLQQ